MLIEAHIGHQSPSAPGLESTSAAAGGQAACRTPPSTAPQSTPRSAPGLCGIDRPPRRARSCPAPTPSRRYAATFRLRSPVWRADGSQTGVTRVLPAAPRGPEPGADERALTRGAPRERNDGLGSFICASGTRGTTSSGDGAGSSRCAPQVRIRTASPAPAPDETSRHQGRSAR